MNSRMTKRLVAVFMSVSLMAVLLSACGKKPSASDPGKGSGQETQEEIVKVTVEDAVNAIRRPNSEDEMEVYRHSVRIRLPKISLDTENAQAFNRKMYDVFGTQYEKYAADEEPYKTEHGCSCDYEYRIYKNVVGIILYYEDDEDFGIEGFYYDAGKDKELTFDEYLTAFGLTKSEAVEKINNRPVIKQLYMDKIEDFAGCILNEKGTSFFEEDVSRPVHLQSILDNGTVGDGEVIDFGYFTMVIPEEWRESYQYSISEVGPFVYSFREKNSAATMYGGEVCHIYVAAPSDEKWDPGASTLCYVSRDGQKMEVVLSGPTDVCFPPQYAYEYRAMSSYVDAFCDSIQFKENVKVLEK